MWSTIATYHLVFCPQYRRKVLLPPSNTRLKILIQEGVGVEKGEQARVEVRAMSDHVHLMVGCDPQFGIHQLVRSIKGSISHHLQEAFPELKSKIPSLRTNSSFVGTVGGVTMETVRRYIANQKDT